MVVLGLAFSAWFNGYTYFVRQANDAAVWAAYSTPETLVARRANELGSGYAYYIANFYRDTPTLRFLAPWLTLTPDGAGPVSGELDGAPTLLQVAGFDESLSPLVDQALDGLAAQPASPRKAEQEAQLGRWLECLRESSDRARQRMDAAATEAVNLNDCIESALELVDGLTETLLDESCHIAARTGGDGEPR